MTSPWARLRFSAAGAIEALAATSDQVVEVYARARIELARSELRHGRIRDGLAVLQGMMDRLYSEDSTRSSDGVDLALAIAKSVLGQGLEQVRDTDNAQLNFRDAVEQFQSLPDSVLNPRDHSDFGVALAATGAEDDGVEHLRRSRDTGGFTLEAARYMAMIQLRDGDTDGAERLLKKTMLAWPDDPEMLRALGMIQAGRKDSAAPATLASAVYALMNRERYGEALDVLDALDDLAPASTDLAGVRAEALRLSNRPEPALDAYRSALERQPDSAWLLAGLASAQMALARYDEASTSVDQALQSLPRDQGLLALAGEISLQLGDGDKAIELGRRAVAADPRDPTAHHLLALAAHAFGDVDEARAEIRSATLLAPNDVNLLFTRGEFELEAGSAATAAEVFRQITALPDSTPEHHAKLVLLLGDLGDTEQAAQAGQTALERFGDTEPVLYALGRTLLAANEVDPSIDYLRRAVAMEDHDHRSTLMLAHGLVMAADLEGVLEVTDLARREAPDSPAPHSIRARAYAQAGNWPEAMDWAGRALDIDPSAVEPMVILGVAALARGDSAEARTWLRRAADLDPEDPQLRAHLAEALSESEPEEALALLNRVIDEDGVRTAESLRLRADLMVRVGSPLEQAVSDLTAATELDPEDATLWAELADLTRLNGDPERALGQVNRALAIDPGSSFALTVRASAYQALKRDREAREDLIHAVESDPRYVEAHLRLAQFARDLEEAQHHLDRARDVSPTDRQVEIGQASLYVQQGRYAEALAIYERLLEGGQEIDVVVGHTDVLRLLGRPTEAVHVGEIAVGRLGSDPQVRRSLGIALIDSGKHDEGIDVLRKLVEESADAGRKGDLGWALAAGDRPDEALAMFDDTLLETPGDTWTLVQTSLLLSEIGDFPASAALAQRVVDVDPDSAEAWLRIGWAAQYLDPPDHARGEYAYDRAWQLQPTDHQDPWVLTGRADCRRALGDSRAGDDYRQALELARSRVDTDPWLRSTIGWCSFQLGDLSSAARMFLEARSLEERPGRDSFDLALVTLCHGQHDRARELYVDAVEAIRILHPLKQRGLVKVALEDLVQASAPFQLADGPVTSDVLSRLRAELDRLPSPPKLAYLMDSARSEG